MAENKKLFNLEWARFNEIWDPPNCFKLQHEFRTNSVPLTNCLLTWQEGSGDKWLIADFENKKTYDIRMVSDAGGNPSVEVWERSSDEAQPATSEGTEDILSHLHAAQGTNRGFIDLLTRLNLDELDLERLKRSDLSAAGFDFQFVHEDLSIVHSMLQEILSISRRGLLSLSRDTIQELVSQLQQFYDKVRKIDGFEIGGTNPKETHSELLGEISDFFASAKEPLGRMIAHLSPRKLQEIATQTKSNFTAAAEKLDAETNRAEKINNETEQKHAEMQEEFERLKLDMQNQLAEKPISQYKEIFAQQAKRYRTGAWIWLGSAILTIVVFFGIFYSSPSWLNSKNDHMVGALQNLFTKGLFLSPIYVWLNRSIKNYSAQKHLQVINTHRQKALDTFDAFVAAADGNRETRDAVLLAATDAIFDANQTGYLSTKGTGPDSRNPILHVIRESMFQKSRPREG